ncbi:MAG: Bifunctional ligase/repressor BirA [Holosporales bacterium]
MPQKYDTTDDLDIKEFKTLPSTHLFAREHHEACSKNTLIVTDQQTAGIGRRGGVWISPLGNFYGTFIIKNRHIEEEQLSHLSFIAAVSIGRYFKNFNFLDFSYKWPNDIFNQSNTHKLGGILIEKTDNDLLISIGINMKNLPEKPITNTFTSLHLLHNANTLLKNWDHKELFKTIIETLANYQQNGFSVIKEEWMLHCGHKNKFITTYTNKSGIFKDINEDGSPVFESTSTVP